MSQFQEDTQRFMERSSLALNSWFQAIVALYVYVDNVDLGMIDAGVTMGGDIATVDGTDTSKGTQNSFRIVSGATNTFNLVLSNPTPEVEALLGTRLELDPFGSIKGGTTSVGTDLSIARVLPVRLVKAINGNPSTNPADWLNIFAVEFKVTGDITLAPGDVRKVTIEGIIKDPDPVIYGGQHIPYQWYIGAEPPYADDGVTQYPSMKLPILPKLSFNGDSVKLDYANSEGITLTTNTEFFGIAQRVNNVEIRFKAKLIMLAPNGTEVLIGLHPDETKIIDPNKQTRIFAKRGAFNQSNGLGTCMLPFPVAHFVDDDTTPPEGRSAKKTSLSPASNDKGAVA
jgi:hypothetical protein